jgi:predicted transcriptional regulator of viral defense system
VAPQEPRFQTNLSNTQVLASKCPLKNGQRGEAEDRQERAWIDSSDISYTIRGFYPMPTVDAGLAKARHVFTKHGGMLRTSAALRLGIHPRTLYTLRDTGDIERIGRGLYRLSTAPPLSSPDLVPIAIRIPRAVVCLISALAHHGLTTQVPHSIDVALPSHAQIPKIDAVPLRVFWYPEPSFSAGVEVVTVDKVPVRIYSSEKTIADCFKYRNKIGLDLAIEALRAYRERTRKPDFKALTKFAQINRVQRVMRPYLESIL